MCKQLADFGIVNIACCLNYLKLPLSGNCDINNFKLYFSDTGLLISLLDDGSQTDLRENRNLGVCKGALYENMVAEALVKSGYSLYYYKKRDSTLEEDFFIRSKNELVPIEVKATNGKSKSLKTLIESNKYSEISYGFKLSLNNIGYLNHIYAFPYFCAFLIRRFMKDFEPFELNDQSK